MSLLNASQHPPVVGGPEMTVTEACALMAQHGVAAVAVVDDGRLAGIFTERDITLKMVPQGLDAKSTWIGQLMTTPVKTTTVDTSVSDALSFMLDNHVRHLPIVNEAGEILGMLSMRSIMKQHIEYLDNALQGLTAYMSADGPGG